MYAYLLNYDISMILVDDIIVLNIKLEEMPQYQETIGEHNRNFKVEANMLYIDNRNRVSINQPPADLSVMFGISYFSSKDLMKVRVY